jgi:hypothetical protein
MYNTIRQQCNKLFPLSSLSHSTQHVSALNGHLQVSYYSNIIVALICYINAVGRLLSLFK